MRVCFAATARVWLARTENTHTEIYGHTHAHKVGLGGGARSAVGFIDPIFFFMWAGLHVLVICCQQLVPYLLHW